MKKWWKLKGITENSLEFLGSENQVARLENVTHSTMEYLALSCYKDDQDSFKFRNYCVNRMKSKYLIYENENQNIQF